MAAQPEPQIDTQSKSEAALLHLKPTECMWPSLPVLATIIFNMQASIKAMLGGIRW